MTQTTPTFAARLAELHAAAIKARQEADAFAAQMRSGERSERYGELMGQQIEAEEALLNHLLNHPPKATEAILALVTGMTPKKLRIIADYLDLLDVIAAKVNVVGDEKLEARLRGLVGTEAQSDLRSWAAALEALNG